MKFRNEIHQEAAKLILDDLKKLQVSQRRAAKYLGIPVSTLNAFLNTEYRTSQKKTLDRLLAASPWSPDTVKALEDLRDYENSLFLPKSLQLSHEKGFGKAAA